MTTLVETKRPAAWGARPRGGLWRRLASALRARRERARRREALARLNTDVRRDLGRTLIGCLEGSDGRSRGD